jgi:hypothetical protein
MLGFKEGFFWSKLALEREGRDSFLAKNVF